MKNSISLLAILLACSLISCDFFSDDSEEQRIHDSIDVLMKKWEEQAKQNTITANEVEDTVEINPQQLKSNPFNDYYLLQKVQKLQIPCNSSFSFSQSSDIDSILSFMDCVKDRKNRIKLLRRVLLLSHYEFERKIDTLKYLSDRDLSQMLGYVVDQDIESEAMDSNSPILSELYSNISTLVQKNASKALVLHHIKDSVFNYFYLSYSFQKPTKNILMLDYNAAGMAGSAYKRYFRKVEDTYKEINLKPIIQKVNKVMTKIAKEDATADTDRFEGMFRWDKQKGSYEMQLFVHVSSGAMCCPAFIVRLYTKDFKTIESRSMQFATTQHFSDSTIKPNWKTIQ